MDAEVDKAPPDTDTMDQIKALFDAQAKRMDAQARRMVEFEHRITTKLDEMSQMIKQGQQVSLKRDKQSTMEGIQLSPIDWDPEDYGPEVKRPRLRAIDMISALDVHNFAMHWPKWSNEFQVYVAANFDYHLCDGLKLTILMESIGAEGSSLVASLYHPQTNSVIEDTYDEIWWRLSELSDVDINQRWIRDMSEERRNQMGSGFQDIKKDEEKCLLLIPHLSLCELECLTGAVPRLEQSVRNHAKIFGVRIEKCCLEKHDQEVFVKYKTITSVTLNNISESQARGVLPQFTNIKRFAMHNMQIFEDISGFPGELSDLALVGCKIQETLMNQWVSQSNFSLRRFCLVDFKHAFMLPNRSCDRHLHFRCKFDGLRSLSIKGDFIDFVHRGRGLQFLKIATKWLRKLDIDFSNVTHFNVNQPQLRFHSPTSLKFLATDSCISLKNLHKFTSLECLWIMCPVSPDYKEEIDQLGIRKVIVNYEPVPPEEPNLIFDMLNEYCLLEITDYLSIPDWMRFGQLHWKGEMALVSYKYPRAKLNDWIIKDSEISTDSDHFNYIAQVVTKCLTSDKNLLAKFRSLKSWSAKLSYDSDILEALPALNVLDNLEELEMALYEPDNILYLQSLFQRVNSTLRVLKLGSTSNYNGLLELHNLLEIELTHEIPNDQLMLVLHQNAKLRRIHITFREDMTITENISEQIGKMKDLTDLAITAFGSDQDRILADLLARVGPQLTKLLLSGNYMCPEMVSLSNGGLLKNIQAFDVDVWLEEDIQDYLIIIRSMTSLRKLRCEFDGLDVKNDEGNFNILEDSELLSLIKSLPFLVELEIMPSPIYTLTFEMELQSFLKKTSRKLRINKVAFP